MFDRRGRRPARTTDVTRPRLLSMPLALCFVSSFGAMTSFYLLLSVVPLYAAHVGAGRVGAGLAVGVLMLATVCAELVTPTLMRKLGYRWMFAVSLLLLGVPALAMTLATSIAPLLVVCVVRGIGLAFVVVLGSALVASLVPAGRQGEGLGLYGVVVGIPAVIALPLGVWLARHVGYPPLFVTSAVIALACLPAVSALPGRPEPAASAEPAEPIEPPAEPIEPTEPIEPIEPIEPTEPAGVLAGLRTPTLLRPATAFFATTMAAGIVVAFVPLAITGASGGLAAAALFAQAASATLSRWWAGRHGDRHGSARLLVPGLVCAAAGMLALTLTTSPAAVLVAMVLFGSGFGVTQNASLTMMISRVPTSGYGTASAVWNIAYDGGLGVGAAGFGLLAARTGYAPGFAITAAVMLAALVPALRDRTSRLSQRRTSPLPR